MAAAVNCLETEPASMMDSGVSGTSYSRFDMPYALARMVRPWRDAPTAHPGVTLVNCEKMLSTRAIVSRRGDGCPCATGDVAASATARTKSRMDELLEGELDDAAGGSDRP